MDYETSDRHAAMIESAIENQTKVLERIAYSMETVVAILGGCQHYLTDEAQAFRTISVNRK